MAPAMPSVIVATSVDPVTVPVIGPPLKQLVVVSEIAATPDTLPSLTDTLKLISAVITDRPVGLVAGSLVVNVTEVMVPEYELAGGVGPADSVVPLVQLVNVSAKHIAKANFLVLSL